MKKVLKKFGKYLLLDRLAQGGMAEIFRAWAPSVDGGGRLIVLKCVQPSFGQDPEFIQMFRSEIRVTMGLNHPNIVQLYDFGEFQNQPFIAMELVEGKSLKQFTTRILQKNQQIAPEYAAHVISQAAAGLHYAHTFHDRTTGQPLNIIHRDVSPQNLLLSYDGNLKIIDFGIAKAASNRQATRAGVIKGKPSYLSPEQIEGLELDGRSDVFSLGAVLWEALAGKKLFTGDSDLAAIRMIEECDKTVKPPSKLNTAVPPELDAIVLKALAKNRDQRYKTAEEMQRALHRFIYSFNPDFDPSEFAKYVQSLFKIEIEQEQRAIRELNIEASELFEQAGAEKGTEKEPEKATSKEPAKVFTGISLESVPIDLHSNPGVKLREKRAAQLAAMSGRTLSKSTSPGVKRIGKVLVPLLVLGAGGYFFAPMLLSKLVRSSSNTQKAQLNPGVSVAHNTTTPTVGLKLEIAPAGGISSVSVNHQPIDPTSLRIPIGTTFTLTVTKDGFKPFEKQLTSATGSTEIAVKAVLEPISFGSLTLHTTPTAEAQILSNGLIWSDSTPIENLKLPPGHYQIQLSNQLLGMKKLLTVEIRANRDVSKDVNLDVIQ